MKFPRRYTRIGIFAMPVLTLGLLIPMGAQTVQTPRVSTPQENLLHEVYGREVYVQKTTGDYRIEVIAENAETGNKPNTGADTGNITEIRNLVPKMVLRDHERTYLDYGHGWEPPLEELEITASGPKADSALQDILSYSYQSSGSLESSGTGASGIRLIEIWHTGSIRIRSKGNPHGYVLITSMDNLPERDLQPPPQNPLRVLEQEIAQWDTR